MFRRAAELLSRRLVFKRHLPREFGGGPLFVSPESGLKFYRKDLRRTDLTLFRMATELVRPGATIWDIGANIGLLLQSRDFRDGSSPSNQIRGLLALCVGHAACRFPDVRP